MWCLVISATVYFPANSPKNFLEETKKEGMARDVTNRGGVRGGIPPAFTRTTGTSKSPSEAVFIIVSAQGAFPWLAPQSPSEAVFNEAGT